MSTATTPTVAPNGAPASETYGLLDAESANLLGTYSSEPAALRVVADLAGRYGPESPAVASLVLYRTDVPDAESVVSEGPALVRRALTLDDISHKASDVLASGASRTKAKASSDHTLPRRGSKR